MCNGELFSGPALITDLKKMSVHKLRQILRFHNVWDCGTKDELAIRVGMVKCNRGYLVFYKEREGIKDIINVTKTLIRRQKEMYFTDAKVIYKKRIYSTPSGPSLSSSHPRSSASIPHNNLKSILNVPVGITLDSLQEMLDPLQCEINVFEETKPVWHSNIQNADLAAIRSSGAKILAYLSKDELRSTGWKTGKMNFCEDTSYSCINRC